MATTTVEEVLGGDRIRVETTARVPDRDDVVISGAAVVLSTHTKARCRRLGKNPAPRRYDLSATQDDVFTTVVA